MRKCCREILTNFDLARITDLEEEMLLGGCCCCFHDASQT